VSIPELNLSQELKLKSSSEPEVVVDTLLIFEGLRDWSDVTLEKYCDGEVVMACRFRGFPEDKEPGVSSCDDFLLEFPPTENKHTFDVTPLLASEELEKTKATLHVTKAENLVAGKKYFVRTQFDVAQSVVGDWKSHYDVCHMPAPLPNETNYYMFDCSLTLIGNMGGRVNVQLVEEPKEGDPKEQDVVARNFIRLKPGFPTGAGNDVFTANGRPKFSMTVTA